MNMIARAAPRARTQRRVGRFVLIEEIGRGAQATVWRAHDERLDREVALKLLRADADTVAVSQWLHEARAVSRLAHPHVVPVFEADDSGGMSYLVFELVRGRTLAQLRRERGSLPAREAVALMLGVLDALRAAHDQGIVHRDLKPSNILVDGDGRARVMDFGIAARVADSADGRVVGTPGFMSPEAARGMAPNPCMDVFSAGMVLADLLCGGPLLREADPHRALHRVIHEDLELPSSVVLDDGLRGIVHRAIARDAGLRYDGAAALRDALARWLEPEDAARSPQSAVDAQGTLGFLLRRMRHRSDFPAMSEAVSRIHRLATSDTENLHSLAGAILEDVALTNKLLRLVNSAHFSGSADGGVSTVSRAVALVGFAGIRNLALSLVLVEHMKNKEHAARLRHEFTHALLAGQVASELAAHPREQEEAFLGAMFRNLGRMLAEYYFPDEAQQVRERLGVAADPVSGAQREQALSEQLLGIRYEALGLGVARHWGLPDALQHCMRRWDGAPPARPQTSSPERLRCLAAVGEEAAAALLSADSPLPPSERLRQVTERWGRAIGLDGSDVRHAVKRAEHRLVQVAPAMGLVLPASIGAPAPDVEIQAGAASDSLAPYALTATVHEAAAASPSPDAPTVLLPPRELSAPTSPAVPTPAQASAMLAAGIQDVTQTIVSEQFRLNEVLRMILETMMRALGLQRVLFCLRDPRGTELHGRFGLGEGAMALAPHFRIPLQPGRGATPDLFTAVCLKGTDTLIADASAPSIAPRLPAWFNARVKARSFLLLPLMIKGAPFALIYADRSFAGPLELGEAELALLRTLRNQAVLAFRQAGG